MKSYLLFLIASFFLVAVAPVNGKEQISFFDQGPQFQLNNPWAPVFDDSLNFNLCQVITGPEITTLAPFTATFTKAAPGEDGHLERFTSCYYEFKYDRQLGFPQASIEINEFQTAKESQENFRTRTADWKNQTLRDPQYYFNSCDLAVFYDGNEDKVCGSCRIETSCGRYYIAIGFAESSTAIPGRKYKDSEESVLNLLLNKKPFLRDKK